MESPNFEKSWELIKSAPKDGTSVLVFDTFSKDKMVDGFGQCVASYNNDYGWTIINREGALVTCTNPIYWKPLGERPVQND